MFRKVDAVCRHHAPQRRNQGWVGVCAFIDRSRDRTKSWRLLKSVLMVPRPFHQVMCHAVHLSIREWSANPGKVDHMVDPMPSPVVLQARMCVTPSMNEARTLVAFRPPS